MDYKEKREQLEKEFQEKSLEVLKHISEDGYCSMEEYIKKNKLSNSVRTRLKNSWKTLGVDGEATNIFEENKRKYREEWIPVIVKALPLINDGIEIDGKIRKFDIIDLYTCFPTKLHYILDICRYNLPDEKTWVLKGMILDNYKRDLVNTDEATLSKNFTFYDGDKKYQLSEDEKMKVYQFLKSNNIPVCSESFTVAAERCHNFGYGVITPSNIDEYTKKNKTR